MNLVEQQVCADHDEGVAIRAYLSARALARTIQEAADHDAVLARLEGALKLVK